MYVSIYEMHSLFQRRTADEGSGLNASAPKPSSHVEDGRDTSAAAVNQTAAGNDGRTIVTDL